MKLTFQMFTKVIMGENCINDNFELVKSMGKRALVVTGAASAKKSGALDDVVYALKAAGKSYVVYDKVMANPTVDCVYDGAAVARKEETDFVIAIGGGSAMDAAKAIALLARQIMPRKKLLANEFGADVLPMAHVPTTAGTGSEVTPYAILTDDQLQTKKSIASEQLFPRYAFLDAKYLESLPHSVTVNTAIDALTHAVEGMLTLRASEMSDFIAKESIQKIASCFDALESGSLTKEHKERLLYASMLAGIVIANTATTALHAMGYPLTYYKNIDHGRANGLLMAGFLEHVYALFPDRIEKILLYMNYKSLDSLRILLNNLLGRKEVITENEIELYAKTAIEAKNISNTPGNLTEPDLIQIYKQSFK